MSIMDVGTDDPLAEDGISQPSLGLVSIVNEKLILGGDSSEDEEECEVVVQNVMNHVSKDTNFKKGFTCPECFKDVQLSSRPVQETCGHVKCRQCFISSEEACKQCVEKTARASSLKAWDTRDTVPEPKCPEQSEEKKEIKKSAGKKGQVTFKLEQPCGATSIVIVSTETLKELGIEEIQLDDEDDADDEIEDNANHNHEEIDCIIDDGDNVNIVEIKDEDWIGDENSQADKESEIDAGDTKDVNIVEIKEEDQNDEEQGGGENISTESIPATNHSNDHATNDDETTADTTSSAVRRKGKKIRMVTDHIITLTPEVSSTKRPLFKCLKCNSEYTRKFHRQYHIYCNPANGKNPFVCTYCSKICLNGSHLVYHVRSQHTNEKPFQCNICKHNFHQKVKLNRHMRVHDENWAAVAKKPKVYTTRYLCAYCKKAFNELSNCKRHLLTHTGQRPFICTSCTKTFKSKFALDSHMKTLHNMDGNNRPYKCSDCDFAFIAAKDLRRHVLSRHSAGYPYQCKICDMKCRRKDNFERHLRNTHQLSESVRKMMSKEALENYEKSKRIKLEETVNAENL